MELHTSRGEDKAQVKDELQALFNNGWKLNEDQEIEKTYHFKLYTKVLDFHHGVGVASKAKNHHPTMETKAGSLRVRWKTHNPPGLSAKDTSMARYCDSHADMIGTVEPSESRKCGPGS